MKDLSINTIIFIIIVLFINIGFIVKMLNQYHKTKKSGYLREEAFQEQLEQRVMRSFGNKEELNKLIHDFVRYKDAAEKNAVLLKEQDVQLKLLNRKLEDSMIKCEEEKARFQKEVWALEDLLSQTKDIIREKDWELHELADRLKMVKEALLKKQLEERSEIPGRWHIPAQ